MAETLARSRGSGSPDAMLARFGLVKALSRQNRFTEADPIFRELVPYFARETGAESRFTTTASYYLGLGLSKLGRRAEAALILAHTLEIQQRAFGADDPDTNLTRAAKKEAEAG